jgi:hypothetical protein
MTLSVSMSMSRFISKSMSVSVSMSGFMLIIMYNIHLQLHTCTCSQGGLFTSNENRMEDHSQVYPPLPVNVDQSASEFTWPGTSHFESVNLVPNLPHYTKRLSSKRSIYSLPTRMESCTTFVMKSVNLSCDFVRIITLQLMVASGARCKQRPLANHTPTGRTDLCRPIEKQGGKPASIT